MSAPAPLAESGRLLPCPGARGVPGRLSVPRSAAGLVIVLRGGAALACSDDPGAVSSLLQREGLATLLVDLPGADPAAQVGNDTLLAMTGRVVQALAWTALEPLAADLPIGLMAGGTAAAAALVVAATRPARVAAVVSCAGRVERAAGWLARVRAPTLLIAGGGDARALADNRSALRQLACRRRLEVVPGAARRFGGAGTFAGMVATAAAWFNLHLPRRRDVWP